MSASSGRPYLKPNDITVARSCDAVVAAERGVDLAAQVVDVERRGVDDEVGARPQVAEQRALAHEAVEDAARALQRVRAAAALEPADQHVVAGLEEQHAQVDAVGRATRCERPSARSSNILPPRTSTTTASRAIVGRRPAPASTACGEQRGRQVVDDEPAEVLQRPCRGGAAGAGHAGDEHQLERRILGPPRSLLRSVARAVQPCAAGPRHRRDDRCVARTPISRGSRPWRC